MLQRLILADTPETLDFNSLATVHFHFFESLDIPQSISLFPGVASLPSQLSPSTKLQGWLGSWLIDETYALGTVLPLHSALTLAFNDFCADSSTVNYGRLLTHGEQLFYDNNSFPPSSAVFSETLWKSRVAASSLSLQQLRYVSSLRLRVLRTNNREAKKPNCCQSSP